MQQKNNMSIEVKCYFFATIRELVGQDSLMLVFPEKINVRELKEHLIEKYDKLKGHLDTTLVSINREFALDNDQVNDGDEIALFPPVSGGLEGYPTICSIIKTEFNYQEIISRITLPTTGAACFFIGVVRENTLGEDFRRTLRLEYESYEDMAVKKMMQVAEEIREKWTKVEGISIIQRIGILLPGSPTVVVACSSPHRDDGIFEAAHYGINRLKEIVPIWKKEINSGNSEWIEGEYIPKPGE